MPPFFGLKADNAAVKPGAREEGGSKNIVEGGKKNSSLISSKQICSSGNYLMNDQLLFDPRNNQLRKFIAKK